MALDVMGQIVPVDQHALFCAMLTINFKVLIMLYVKQMEPGMVHLVTVQASIKLSSFLRRHKVIPSECLLSNQYALLNLCSQQFLANVIVDKKVCHFRWQNLVKFGLDATKTRKSSPPYK